MLVLQKSQINVVQSSTLPHRSWHHFAHPIHQAHFSLLLLPVYGSVQYIHSSVSLLLVKVDKHASLAFIEPREHFLFFGGSLKSCFDVFFFNFFFFYIRVIFYYFYFFVILFYMEYQS